MRRIDGDMLMKKIDGLLHELTHAFQLEPQGIGPYGGPNKALRIRSTSLCMRRQPLTWFIAGTASTTSRTRNRSMRCAGIT